MSAPTETIETTEPDNTNVGLIATVTIVGALLVVATAASLTALVRTESAEYGNEVGAYANLGTVRRLKAEQAAKLETGPAWANKEKGLVSLPIDRAMGLVTGEISKNPYLATPEPPPSAAAPAADGSAGPSGMAEPAPSAAVADGKGAPPVPAKEKEKAGTDREKKEAHGDAKGPLKIGPPKGAPVAPAGAPAPHE